MFPHRTSNSRRGSIVVLAAFLMVGMMGLLAFAIDLGVLYVAREELQRCADASATAAAWELIDEDVLTGTGPNPLASNNARIRAEEYAALNKVLLGQPALADQDVEVGYLASFTDPNATVDTASPFPPNAVRVVVRRTLEQNGEVGLFFAKLLGKSSASVQAEATAALLTNFKGFQEPADGGNLDILPFAIDQQTWSNMVDNKIGSDNWKWDSLNEKVIAGPDGILEVNLYPQGTGSPGNRGTVDIGSNNNSTNDIARQIVEGISPSDLAYHGGKLEFDENGKLYLNGDTGISAGVKDELASIIGQPRIVPVFTTVTGPGNNAMYTIVQFVGVRIMEVKLTGSNSSKRVIIQPANVITRGGIPGGTSTSPSFIYSPVRLVK